MESSINHCNGQILQLDYIEKVKKLAEKKKLRMHLDGARSWNAFAALDMEPRDYCKDFDLISVCFSKGMGCPIGSVVIGTEEDIKQARVFRKMLGSGMRQIGVIAAPMLVSLQNWREKILIDNQNARFMAEEIAGWPGVTIKLDEVQTNILRFELHEET